VGLWRVLCISGELLWSQRLPYIPREHAAVTCTHGGIIVAEWSFPARVHVHGWDGKQLATLDHTALGLGERDYVTAVRMCHDTLLLAAGPRLETRSLRACKVSHQS